MIDKRIEIDGATGYSLNKEQIVENVLGAKGEIADILGGLVGSQAVDFGKMTVRVLRGASYDDPKLDPFYDG